MAGFIRRALKKAKQVGDRPIGVDTLEVALYDGKVPLEVVGESFYQANLKQALSQFGRDVHAILLPEPDNEHDPNAVAVLVGGLKVGHLSREDAAPLHRPIVELQRTENKPIALNGRLVGGDSGRPSLGIWLDHEPTDFGLPPRRSPRPGQVLTGARDSDRRWDEGLQSDRLAAIEYFRKALATESNHLDRHFIFNQLEEHLYRSRNTFSSASAEFEAACEDHHAEMSTIRPELIRELGGVPALPTYRQMAIMKVKAKKPDEALAWIKRGIEIYGDECIRRDALEDLQKRLMKLGGHPGGSG